MPEIVMMTREQAEATRQERLNEKGTMAPCPFCGRARVERSDYIRCNRCGVNWLDSEVELTYKGKPYLEVDPRLARQESALTVGKASPSAAPTTGGAE